MRLVSSLHTPEGHLHIPFPHPLPLLPFPHLFWPLLKLLKKLYSRAPGPMDCHFPRILQSANAIPSLLLLLLLPLLLPTITSLYLSTT